MGYCSQRCRDDAWNAYHRLECGWVDVLDRTNVGKHGLLAFRTLLKVKHQLDGHLEVQLTPDDVYDSTDYRTVHGLVANSRQRSVADLFRRSVMAVYLAVIMPTVGDNERIAVAAELLQLLQSYPCNAHEISQLADYEDGQSVSQAGLVEVGAGAMPVLSLLNHSCDPNVVRHCYGDVIVVTTIRRININEEMTDNYGYHYATLSADERRAKLRGQYHFDCACQACEEMWPVYQHIPQLPADAGPASTYRSLSQDLRTDLDAFVQLSPQRMPERDVLRRTADKFSRYISLLDEAASLAKIRRPVREHNDAQEALKQCLALLSKYPPAPSTNRREKQH